MVFWMCLRVDTTPEAITGDLEEMHAKGIEGAILYDLVVVGGLEVSAKMVLQRRGSHLVRTTDYTGGHIDKIPFAKKPSWTPRSHEMIRFAPKEAGRMGVKFYVGVGLSGTSGPIAPEYGQR